jgi:nucleoid-associated protein YgaU
MFILSDYDLRSFFPAAWREAHMLRSGTPRHRKPRKAPAFVITAGATGAGIALPLLGATSAHAASDSTWDGVANCESGGLWSEDSGNGFFGGLQLTLDTWEKYGGTAYAARPDLASRQQQIAVAEQALRAQGVADWQDCALKTGLTQSGPAPVVNPGDASQVSPPVALVVPDAPVMPAMPDASYMPNYSVNTPLVTPSPSHGGTAGASAASPPAASPSAASPSPSPSRGRHAKPVLPPLVTVGGGPSLAVPGEASHDGASDQGGLRHLPNAVPSGAVGLSWTVKSGDNLSQIASERAIPGGWVTLYAANASVVGSNPDLILPGQHLRLG